MKRRLMAVATLACAIGIIAGCAAWFGPSVDFVASTVEGPEPLVVQFTSVSDEPIVSYSWDFGDGETSINPTPVHIYRAAGNFTVSLIAELADGDVEHEVKVDLITVRVPMMKGSPQYIYWIRAFSGTIFRGARDGSEREVIIPGSVHSKSALDVADGWLYWADVIDRAIYRARIDGSGRETLITGQRYVTDITVVPETNSIFWVRTPDWLLSGGDESGGLYFADLDDLEAYALVTYGPQAERFAGHVEVDVMGDNIYWSIGHLSEHDDEHDGHDAIRVTSASGFAPSTIYGEIGRIGDFALDVTPEFAAEHIYWIEHGPESLHRCWVDGSYEKELFAENELTGWLEVDRVEGKIYYTTMDGIERCDLDGTHRELLHEQDAMMGIALPK